MIRRCTRILFRSWRVRNDERGISYLGLMGMIMIIGVTLSIVGQQWSMTVKRDKEKELLFRGTRIKIAIGAYAADYEVRKADRSNRFPNSLEQLTQPPRRFLPRVYKDPITGKDFEVILVKGEIRGVRSTSSESPMDSVNFKDAALYKDMVFEAQDPKQVGATGLDTAINALNPLPRQPKPPEPLIAPGPPATSSSVPAGTGGQAVVIP